VPRCLQYIDFEPKTVVHQHSINPPIHVHGLLQLCLLLVEVAGLGGVALTLGFDDEVDTAIQLHRSHPHALQRLGGQ